jgi:predicted outer membrane repeat protein
MSSPGRLALRLAIAVAVITVAAPQASLAGGNASQQRPTTSPPGPWADNDAAGGPYRPIDARRCPVGAMRDAGPGKLLAIYARGRRCRGARRLVIGYQRCLTRANGHARRCYRRVRRRCVRPAFLGRCREFDTFYYRALGANRCVERHRGIIRGRYDADVSCSGPAGRVDHSYTLFESDTVAVGTEAELRAAWANPRMRSIVLTSDIVLRACRTGDPIREAAGPVSLDGVGHTLQQGCFEKRLLRQDGTGYVELKNVTLTRGGSDGPGGAVTTRGEITVIDSKIKQNLAEEPGGGVMSQRRATIIRSVITGNLANDDGGGVYARRGGIQVYDSILSGNLVDGSGGALGSTGDILVVRSHLDGNTTDGDGGAIYTDEDGDVTVIDSTVSGSTADGPGGAIFTLDGDVTIVNSTLAGNRADDRGGAVSGEADVIVLNSTISRNIAVAHVGGGLSSRGDMYVGNSTVSNNYAEAKGGGLHAAGALTLVNSTVASNIASVGGNIGVGERLDAFGSVIGPTKIDNNGGQVQATKTNCDAPAGGSLGFNVVSDASCRLGGHGDLIGVDTKLGSLESNTGPHETLLPLAGSPAIDLIPADRCRAAPLPEVHEGEHHLRGHVPDLRALMLVDERGFPRPGGGACDAGAVEVAR